ncbi:multidrug transporter subunit MdtL, partial [Salmonella enterica]
LVFMIAPLLCSRAPEASLLPSGRLPPRLGPGPSYVVASAILRDTLDEHPRPKAPSFLHGPTCIVPVPAP